MIKIIQNCKLYSPEFLGYKDILVVNDKIEEISDRIFLSGVEYKKVDADGLCACPGFIDEHVHVIGGGGQEGFNSFIPEVNASDLVEVGTTTVLGLLGTDGYVKELGPLYAKVKQLDEQGITAYMLTSFYGVPPKTITGEVASDLIYIDKVIGCKLAMSDDRSSFPTKLEILRLINQVRLGGFTSGKHGILHIHLGNLPSRMDLLLEIAREYPTLISYISPTHTIRTSELFEQSMEFARMGGFIDISTGGTKFTDPHKAVAIALENGVSIGNMAFSTDGRGGVKGIDPVSGKSFYRPAPLDKNFVAFKALVNDGILEMENALRLLTSNPARNLSLRNKGRIAKGADADIVLMDNNMDIVSVYAGGERLK